MSVPIIRTAFTTGEVAPALFGHVDLARMSSAASTFRNGFVGIRGGYYSRAGTKFVGFSKQTGRFFPPRMVNFQFSINQGLALEFGNQYMRVVSSGAFVTETPIAITGASQTDPAVINAVNSYSNGDWLFIANVVGMTQLNGETFVIEGRTGTTFQLFDVYGNPVDATAFGSYISGGTAARIYTLATPYSEADLAYLKWTQSADVMSIDCVNQVTGAEYAPQDLSRIADDNWVFTPTVAAPTVTPPAAAALATSVAGTVGYSYVVTAVSPSDGTESVASPIATIVNGVNLTTTPGAITLTWTPVAGVNEYNVYKAQPSYDNTVPPVGSLFGYAGSAFGTQFKDPNIVQDFAQVPPIHNDPFARGQIIGGTITAGGSGYTDVGFTITTSTGSGAELEGVLVGGILVAVLVVDPGKDYALADTVTVTGSGGSGATADLVIGALTGTYPSTVAYFQERRVHANTLNNPDTYFMSQPGSFTNYDYRIPTIDSDAITGTPWGVQVNGIQFLLPVPSGLVAFTGLSAWLLGGSGGGALNPQPISPSSQSASPQGYVGCSPTVPPVKVAEDIIFVPDKGCLYRSVTYQIQTNFYSVDDISVNSPHLFTGYTIKEHAWCEEPFKLLWAVRNDGTLLCLTRLKTQEVLGWSRSDTNGLFQSVCSVTEPPVDALYLAVQRFPSAGVCFMIERMDDRLWSDVEGAWCVDCALSLPQPTPNAALTMSPPNGLGAITGVTDLVGGEGYSAATTAAVVDDNGQGAGTGAIPTLTIVGGVITGVSFAGHEGSGYTFPALAITDPAGSAGGGGASARPVLDNSATFEATVAVFASGDVGKVIRMGGGVATITSYVDTQHVIGQVIVPVTAIIPSSGGLVIPSNGGEWTMTRPVTTISGLGYMAGLFATGLADGNVITPVEVPTNGIITLPVAASAVKVGLGFQAQLQSVYLEAGSPTVQGQRKKIAAVTARLQNSRGIKVGTNQVDGSTLSPPQVAVQWRNLDDVPDNGPNFPAAPYNSTTIPLRTGDIRVSVKGGFATPGQVCFQQDNPWPMELIAAIPELFPGDTVQNEAPKQQGRGQ